MAKSQQIILVVEDDAAIRGMLQMTLEGAGYKVQACESVVEGLEFLNRERPCLCLLDWMLPGLSGVEFTSYLRRDESLRSIPVIMLTAKSEEEDKLLGFDAGVDDFITKPFSVKELLARIKAVLKRANPLPTDDEVISVGGLSVDPQSHRVTGEGNSIKLGPTEFRLLHFFMTHRERVYSRGQLLDQVWGETVYVEERTVDVHIRRLRKALEPWGFDRLIHTVRGAGYRFSEQD